MKTIFKTERSASIKKQTSNNIHYFLLWILAVMTFSCNENLEIDISPVEILLEVKPASIVFAANETDTQTAEVTTNASDWTFSVPSSATWLTVEKEGNTLQFTPNSPNTGTSDRSTTVTVRATNADPVAVQVRQSYPSAPQPVIYNTVKCDYLGDNHKTGTANFYFNMYHSDDPRVGIRISAFCALPASFAEFKLDAGVYTVATSGAVRTIIPGIVDGSTITFSCFYDESTSNWTLIKGGSITVSLSGNTYTITTNLTGEDIHTGATVNVKPSTFTGVIEFTDKTESNPCITYNTADCDYWDDYYDTGTANFDLFMFNSSDPDIGIRIEGFCTLPAAGFANFKLDAGTYTLAKSGAVRTFMPGNIEGTSIYSTYLFNRNTNQYTLITGGTFTVSLSGNTYTIATNFSGEDSKTGAAVKDICINFTGTINFVDKSDGQEPDPDIVKSNYSATATPNWAATPGASKWTGTIEPEKNDTEKWYKATNWANIDITIYLDDNDGKITIDDYTKIVETGTHEGYFRVGFYVGSNLLILGPSDDYKYDVHYDPSTKKITFSDKVIFNSNEFAAIIGVAAYNKTNGNPEGVFGDFYDDVVFQLTPIQSTGLSVQKSVVSQTHSQKKYSDSMSRSSSTRNQVKMTTEKSVKTTIQMIPLIDLKMINSDQIQTKKMIK